MPHINLVILLTKTTTIKSNRYIDSLYIISKKGIDTICFIKNSNYYDTTNLSRYWVLQIKNEFPHCHAKHLVCNAS